jgi:hypothetical protein
VGALRRLVDRLVHRQLPPASDSTPTSPVRQRLLAHVTNHLAATHRHYDRLIAQHSIRMDEIDERQLRRTADRRRNRGAVRPTDLVLETAERSCLRAGRPAAARPACGSAGAALEERDPRGKEMSDACLSKTDTLARTPRATVAHRQHSSAR